ncbi:hypothetical protein KFL_001840140 [Klebsormidium nitens]|uniref:Uncharacterized protein n=1 Tax=Klebsormidium nitens TaxID=105231 RepID=A0A1Y1I077_KLENI|nr:hypothetical protein KFL_001840140 [Klebsormidium nitens]|eukprot:GAQ84315.1 hypothetical protein KFL_001840140 [Klebsormidium nitens]
MAARFVLLATCLFCLFCAGGVRGQGNTNLSISGVDSTVAPRFSGGPTGFSLNFNPPQTETTGVIQLNIIACGSAALPLNVSVVGTNITSSPPVFTVSANTTRGFAGTVTVANVSLNVSTPPFPVNQSDGSYSIEFTGGTIYIGRVNGTLTGQDIDVRDRDLLFNNTPRLNVTGTFKAQPGGSLQMSASLNAQVLVSRGRLREQQVANSSDVTMSVSDAFVFPPVCARSQVVAATGFASSNLTAADTQGGALRLSASLLANGPDPCR